jgi:hypothetical protein
MSSKKAHRAPPAAVAAKIKVAAEVSKPSQPVLPQAPTEQQEQEVRIFNNTTHSTPISTTINQSIKAL